MNLSLMKSTKHKNRISLIFLIFILLCAIIIVLVPFGDGEYYAPTEGDNSNDNSDNTYHYSEHFGSFIRIVIAIFVLAVLLIISVKSYRKRLRFDTPNSIKMDVISRRYIGPKQSLLMVIVDTRKFLLGVTENSINLLAEFEGDFVTEDYGKMGNANLREPFSHIFKKFKAKQGE